MYTLTKDSQKNVIEFTMYNVVTDSDERNMTKVKQKEKSTNNMTMTATTKKWKDITVLYCNL